MILAERPATLEILQRDMRDLERALSGAGLDGADFEVEALLEVAQGLGYEVDRAGFEVEMEKQRERSKGDEAFTNAQDDRAVRYASLDVPTVFVGYDETYLATTVAAPRLSIKRSLASA